MTFTEAWDATVSREEVRKEVVRHGCLWGEFLDDCGDAEEYKGSTVLRWLGY